MNGLKRMDGDDYERALACVSACCGINPRAVPEIIVAAEWVLKSAGYENGEAAPGLQELRVGRHHLDTLRSALAKARGEVIS